MAAAPAPPYASSPLPDYLPARMVNEFVYCPRLFFYEWVEGVFRESVDTIEGQAQHRRVDRETKGMPAAADIGDESNMLGLEGNAARLYFGAFAGLLKAEIGEELPPMFRFDFTGRNRRPPRDAVNALLSLGYSLLVKDLTIACYAAGFDSMLGFYHQPRFGRPALLLDLMEPFRPLIVDSAVITAINTKMVSGRDFIYAATGVALTSDGRKAFYRAYELRMDTLVTHPIFGYRASVTVAYSNCRCGCSRRCWTATFRSTPCLWLSNKLYGHGRRCSEPRER